MDGSQALATDGDASSFRAEWITRPAGEVFGWRRRGWEPRGFVKLQPHTPSGSADLSLRAYEAVILRRPLRREAF